MLKKALPFLITLAILAALVPATAFPPPVRLNVASAATCTIVFGNVQTKQWYTGGFESYVGSAGWEFQYDDAITAGATIDDWGDHTYAGYSANIQSPCVTGSGTPDRAVITVSGDYSDDVSGWATRMSAAVTAVQTVYPSVTTVVFQPPVGGPGYLACPPISGLREIRSSYNAPYIASAITTIVAAGIEDGAHPAVTDCADFANDVGTLTDATVFDYIAKQIADFYVPPPPPTATPTVSPSNIVIDFEDISDVPAELNGDYPTHIIDWGTSQWITSGPYAGFTTTSIGFNGPSFTEQDFTFLGDHRLISIQASNGGIAPSTITISCAGQDTVTQVISQSTTTTIPTNWYTPCAHVTIGSTNGWDTNFDNFVIGPATATPTPTPTPLPTNTPLPTSTPTPTPVPDVCEAQVRINGGSAIWVQRPISFCTPTAV